MKKPNARERLLNTASELFTEKGFSSVGINEIIRRSETAKASFYHHFPSKDDLCAAWLSDTHNRSIEHQESILRAPGNPLDKIEAYFMELKSWLESKQCRGCPYSNTAASLERESERILEQIEAHKQSVRAFFVVLAKDLGLDDNDADQLGSGLFLLYSGATVESQNLRATWPVDAAVDTARLLCHCYPPRH